jgi:serine protease Do
MKTLRTNQPVTNHTLAVCAMCAVMVVAGPVCAQTQQAAELQTIEKQILKHVQPMRQVTVSVRVGLNKASGVIVEDGFVITTGHAVERIGQLATVQLTSFKTREARVHAIDKGNDIALLKLSDSSALPFAKLSRINKTGLHPVVAVGNPGGTQPNLAALVRFGMAASGDLIRSSCQIARGDSGGPLFDLNGRVVGIHRQILKGTENNFHTNAQAIKTNWNRLIAGGVIEGPATPIDKMNWVLPASPEPAFGPACVEIFCGQKRVALGTVVDRENGWIVTKASQLSTNSPQVWLGAKKIATKLLQADQKLDLAVLQTARAWPNQVELKSHPAPPIGSIVLSVLPNNKSVTAIIGAKPRAIEREAGEVGLQVDADLIVTEVRPTSAAKKAGLQNGDQINAIDGTVVTTPRDIGVALKQRDAGDRFQLRISRDDRPLTLDVQLLHPANKRFINETFQLGAAGGSSERRSGFSTVLQHDAAIVPRDCGGPVVNLAGQFVGINVAKVGREAVYMVPADKIIALLQRIRRK